MSRWDALAQYNAEVARGLVHTDEWKAKMAAEQEKFDRIESRGSYADYLDHLRRRRR